MAGVVADAGLVALLNGGLKTSSGWVGVPAQFKLHLFKNNITPDNTTAVGAFTEANFAGYAAATILTADITNAGLAGHSASSSVASKTFTITAGTQDVYGWYATDNSGTVLYGSQRDPAAPITLDAAAVNTLSLILTVQLKDIATP